MKPIAHIVRPLALLGVASTLSFSLMLLSFLLVNEFASKHILSEKVLRLARLINVVIAIQGLLMLMLIWALEVAIAKQRKAKEAESGAPPNAAPPHR